MSFTTQTTKPINLTENIYQREKWIKKLVDAYSAASTLLPYRDSKQ